MQVTFHEIFTLHQELCNYYAIALAEVPSTSKTSTADEYRPCGALICAPCTMLRTANSISRAMATPSARALSAFGAALIRFRTESGTETRSSFFINSALRALTNGQIPAMIGMRQCSMRWRNL